MTTTAEETEASRQLFEAIVKNLPGVSETAAEKLHAVYNGKKSPEEFALQTAKIKEEIIFDTPDADDCVADVLLDKITARAAAARLKISKNREAVEKFQKILGFGDATKETLFSFYASPAAEMFFDEEISAVLGSDAGLENSQKAVITLENKAKEIKKNNNLEAQNRACVEDYAVKYSFPLSDVFSLTSVYAKPGAGSFKQRFDGILSKLQTVNDNIAFNVFLALKTMTGMITAEDAAGLTALAKEINYPLAHGDIYTLGVRYLRQKTPAEIRATLEAVLKRLPFFEIKEENLGLAVEVLTEASEDRFEQSILRAQRRKDMSAFRNQLSKYPFFEDFVSDISKKFAGALTAPELVNGFEEILRRLPCCSSAAENNDLACKVLLGKIPEEEALSQAAYRRDLKMKSLTAGLAPEVLKKYLGTLKPEEITGFFETGLSNWSFWKTDSEKHLYALSAFVAELNGTSSREISSFVCGALEEGHDLKPVSDLINRLTGREKLKLTRDALKKMLADGGQATKKEDGLSSIFDG